jgi:hypothetical protein
MQPIYYVVLLAVLSGINLGTAITNAVSGNAFTAVFMTAISGFCFFAGLLHCSRIHDDSIGKIEEKIEVPTSKSRQVL